MSRYLLCFCVMLSLTNLASAEVIPSNMYEKIIEVAMSNYWGKAKIEDGSFVTPSSEKERTTLPITTDNAGAVIKMDELSSIADWCGLDWESNYLKVMSGARSYQLTEKQVAFVGLLHGVAMGVVNGAIKDKECSVEQKSNIESVLKNSSNQSINFSPSVKNILENTGS